LGGGIWEEAFWVKACGRRHLGGGIWGGSILEKAFVGGICEEASGRRHLGGGMGEGASGWRHLGGCTREKASMRMHPEKNIGGEPIVRRSIWEEASVRRHLGGGVCKKASGRRHLGRGIWGEASGGTHLGGLWGDFREALGWLRGGL